MNWAAASGSSIDRGSTAASGDELSIAPSEAVALDGITREGAGHAVTSAAPLAELEAGEPRDLDPGVAHPRDRVRVALVRDDHARLDRHGVVGVVPLLPFGLILVAACLDHVDVLDPEGIGHGREKVLFDPDIEAIPIARTEADCLDVVHDAGVCGHRV